MEFVKVKTIDWYDNILKSFCRDNNDVTYYCCILALDAATDEKVYLCLDIKYLKGFGALKEIIEADSFRENWNKMSDLVAIKKKNEAYLIKTKNILSNQIQLVKYKDSFRWPRRITWGEYPHVLDKARNIDNWWRYFS